MASTEIAVINHRDQLSNRCNRRGHLRNHFVRGQALVELAVFGSLVILTLGALVRYGLNFDYDQQARMRSFRWALEAADEAGGLGHATAVVVDERHIPEPSDPFAMGSLVPASVEASVMRTNTGDETADVEGELPRVRMALQDQETDCPSAGPGCVTANWRTDSNIPADTLDRYHQVYGELNVQVAGDGVCPVPEVEECDENGCTMVCPQPTNNLTVLDDACEGEVIVFESCVQRARMLVDSSLCEQQCGRTKRPGDDEMDCHAVCIEPIPAPPWYAQDARQASSRIGQVWVFPRLNDLFFGAGNWAFDSQSGRVVCGADPSRCVRVLGLQPGFRKERTVGNALHKTETPATISTHDERDWTETTTRTLLHKPLGSTTRVSTEEVRTPVQEQGTTPEWTASW